jgi:hypothetical protein
LVHKARARGTSLFGALIGLLVAPQNKLIMSIF